MAQPMTPADLKHLLDTQATCACIDVREPGEYNSTHIPGASLVPRRELEFRMRRLVSNPDAEIVVHCAGRTRSIIGARLLQRMGFRKVYDLRNGTMGWGRAGAGAWVAASGIA